MTHVSCTSADNGARVINVSLGSSIRSSSEELLVTQLNEEGILVVAAAGNDGNSDYGYPASVPAVLSVSAVDSNLRRASFSQYNDQVDLTAPGASIVSTIPAIGITNLDDPNGAEIEGVLMVGSQPPTDVFEAPLFDCGLAIDVCTGATGSICLIERGTTTFAEKSLNCLSGGGVAAIIYNNIGTGTIEGGLGDETIPFPVLGIPQQQGEDLASATRVAIGTLAGGYASLSGTSFSCPYVVGVASRIWSVRPDCTNEQVREALEATARDLGSSGVDDYYGNGLVQMIDAYNYLLSLPGPCGSGAPTPTPPPVTDAPAASPVTNQDFFCTDVSDVSSDFTGQYGCLYLVEPYPIPEIPTSMLAFCRTNDFLEPTNDICDCAVFISIFGSDQLCDSCSFLDATDPTDGDFEISYDCSNLVSKNGCPSTIQYHFF
jgi:subtilisin family serine protease